MELRLIRGGDPAKDGATHAAPAPDDAVLVAAVQRGEPAAATAFHDRVRAVVDRTLRRLLGTCDVDYDDLAQQSLIELVTSLHRFRRECPLEAWASVVTARVVYKQIRRRVLERRLFSVTPPEKFEQMASAEQSVLKRNLLRRIEAHLVDVEDKKAWTYLLHDVHGYDLAEIAAITESSRAAAQSRLVRGRKELHRRIQQDPELCELLETSATAALGRPPTGVLP